ncbi:histamine H3 receptor-like [Babylonia areolata]|uniref:histamine H3 receptor-like n=1 Tax=Babylonia areolata TaxID=304850 RepID=UPI003FD04DEE
MTTTSSDITATQSFSSPDDEEDSDDPSVLPLPWSPFFVVYSTVAIVTAVGGNVLILLSYGRDGQLRDVHNLYLLHLAVCDLLIGAVSMPLYLIYTVLYWRWPMGVVMCKLFLVEDYTLCCMSTLIIILVAADRLALLTLGASYQGKTRKRAYIKLAVCWTCSFLLYSPAILLWDVVTGHSVVPEGDCDVEFNRSIVFVMVTEIISFSVPFVSLAVINGQLLVALKKRRKVGDHQASGPSPKKERSTTNYKDDDTSSKFATDITTILWSVCGDCVNQYLYEAFNWWLWTKSCINPFLYAYHSPRFRRNFQQLLSRVLPHRLSSGRKPSVDLV